MAAFEAVVLTVTVVVPPPATEAGLKLQLLPDGRPEQEAELNWMVPANPFTAVTVSVRLPAAPGFGIVRVATLLPSVKSPVVGEVDAE